MAKASKPKSTQKVSPKKSGIARYLRGMFGLGLLFTVALFIGSAYMRLEVAEKLNTRARIAGSVVLSNPHPIQHGQNILHSRLVARLKRLGYREVNETPSLPGTYFAINNSMSIYFREAHLPDGTSQKPALYLIQLSDNKIIEIHHAKFRHPLNRIWLEPEPIAYLGNTEARTTISRPLRDYPKHLIEALLAIEDERFYYHFGIDPVGISRALIENMKAGRVVQGGSTLTQQLSKGLFFSSERSLSRKLLEAVSAVLIETAFSKEQILEFYLNDVFLEQDGNLAIHGFATASQSLFGKDVSQLTLSESALLAGLVKAPSAYSPRRNPERAKERRALVITKMLDLNYITTQSADDAIKAPLSIKPHVRERFRAPYFADYIRRTLDAMLPQTELLTQSPEATPIIVYSGLEPEYQECAEKAVSSGLHALEKTFPRIRHRKEKLQAALIAVSPGNGRIRAWVGGREYGVNQFDRVSQAKRQPGSAFKPFVYLTALDKSLNNYRVARTTTLLRDEPVSFQMPDGSSWQPKNYDGEFRGDVTLREALTRSLNIPTVELAMKVGIDSVARTAALFGFGSNLPKVPSLALGAGEVSPLTLAQAYNALANGGRLLSLRAITSITDLENNTPLFVAPMDEVQIAGEAPTFVLTNILQTAIERGTGSVVRRLGFTQPAAGKTGTSNDSRDSWFAGYTPHLLAVVWVGYDSNEVHGLTGANGAAPIWTEFMKCVEPMEPDLEFIAPQGVVYKEIDGRSGLVATPACKDYAVTEIFVEDAAPQTPCDELYQNRWDDDPLELPDTSPRHEQRQREGFFESLVDKLWQ